MSDRDQEYGPSGQSGGGQSGGGQSGGGQSGGERPIETLLREALEARARQIGPQNVSIGSPPKETVRRTRPLYRVGAPLLAVAAACAIGYASLRGSGAVADHQVGPAVSASGTVEVSPGPSSSTSPTGTASASGSATSTATGTGAASPSTSGSPVLKTVAPNTEVPATWLTAAEFPLAGVGHWRTPQLTTSGGNGPFQDIYNCAPVGPNTVAELHTAGIDVHNVPAGSGVPIGTGASQWMFYFQDASAASTALATIQSDYRSCAARKNASGEVSMTSNKPLHWTVVSVATDTDAFAYETRTRDSAGKASGGGNYNSDLQEFFVRAGNVITMVQIQGGPSVDPTGDAAATLSTMATRLKNFF